MSLFAYVAYMWHLRGMFAAGTYLAMMCQVNIAVACVLAHICKTVGSKCPFNSIAVWLIFGVWQPFVQ